MKKLVAMMLAITLLVFSAIPVMAAKSPSADSYYDITVDGTTVGKGGDSGIKIDGGSISISTGVVEVGKEVTLTVNPNDGNSFTKWIIDGDYVIVSGSLTSGTITIIPKGDLDINAEFKTDSGKVIKPVSGDKDKSTTSPKTGAMAGTLVLGLLASGSVAVASRKKYTK